MWNAWIDGEASTLMIGKGDIASGVRREITHLAENRAVVVILMKRCTVFVRSKNLRCWSILGGNGVGETEISQNAVDQSGLRKVNGTVVLMLDINSKISSIVFLDAQIKSCSIKLLDESANLSHVIERIIPSSIYSMKHRSS